MSQVSRPMQIALVATVALALVWLVALRPKSSSVEQSAPAPAPAQTAPASDAGAAPGTEGLTSAVDEARDAAATADADARRAQQSSADGATQAGDASASAQPRSSDAGTGGAATANESAGRGGSGSGTAQRRAASPQVRAVKDALRHHRAVAIAFVDPRTADARAVAREVRSVSTFRGRAVTLAVPLARLSDYAFITNTVEVTVAPTVVIVDRRRRATTIVGFADRGEIEQRLADALAAKARR